MKRKNTSRITAFLLALLLTGCGKAPAQTEGEESTPPVKETIKDSGTPNIKPSETADTIAPPPVSEVNTDNLPTFGDREKNSFAMLYHLALTAEEVRRSGENRLLLDEIYSHLVNDIDPAAVDETTQQYLREMRDVIKSVMSVSLKRDRLDYIHNQNQASAFRLSIPSPSDLLASAATLDWKSLAASTALSVVDTILNYRSSNENATEEYLLGGWELDDEELAAITQSRDLAFDYMVDMVREYGLDSAFTLSEREIEIFAEICAMDNPYGKLQRLKAEADTYQSLGEYWLQLADAYYETGKYLECLDCVSAYNTLSADIFRKDRNYANILPKAVASAGEVYSGDDYAAALRTFAGDIMANTDGSDWALRTFAVQVYVEIFNQKADESALNKAYEIALNNTAILAEEQKELNRQYLAPITVPDLSEPDYGNLSDEEKQKLRDEFKNDRKLMEAYYDGLKEARKTELPPLYEPLLLNCDLLFAISEKKAIGAEEKRVIEEILQTNGDNPVFLSNPVNDLYSFAPAETAVTVEMSKHELIIPVEILTEEAVVTIVVTEGENTFLIDDCVVTEVERRGEGIETFFAHVSGQKLKAHKWTAESAVEITVSNGRNTDDLVFRFTVSEYKDRWLVGDTVVFAEA